MTIRWRLLLGLLLAPIPPAIATPLPTLHARIDTLNRDYQVNADLTWSETITVDITVFTERGVREHERSNYTFYPKNQTLDLVEAWTEQPDGTRLQVGDNARFTRPSEAAQSAPGFTSAMTTTVLYPQLHSGSRTHVVWRVTQKVPGLLGFDAQSEMPLETPVTAARVTIAAPAALDLHWTARGDYTVEDRHDGDTRTIVARIANTSAEEPERNMVDSTDFAPLFLATSLPDLKSLGAIYHRQAANKTTVTPEIAALAAKVAGDRRGLPAAEAVYDWVAGNIRYVAVYMDPNDGWVPHAAAEVLHNGYGDCKDHVTLMQAMLAALGIQSEAALIEQGTRTRDLPLWVPQFNHAIVYLPEYDRFANPTNPYARFDSLDRLLAGKTVVLATEAGEVRRTPAARPQDNTYRSDTHIAIDADGTVDGATTVIPSANLASAARAAIANAASPRDVAERLLSATPEGGFGQFVTTAPRDLTRDFSMNGYWRSPHGVTFAAREAFFAVPVGLDLDPPSHLRALLAEEGPRRHPLITAARDFEWRTTLAVPAGVVVSRLPANIDVSNGTGSYNARYERSGSDITVVRHLTIARAVFEASEYADLETLVYAAIDDARAVLALSRVEATDGEPAPNP